MLSIAVFIDLIWRPETGGHVKSWERFARAATGLEGELDLTVHLLGQRQERVVLSPNVCYVTHPPLFSTARRHGIPLVSSEHTDVPKYTQIYTKPVLRRLFGNRYLGRLLVDRWQLRRRRRVSMARAQVETRWPSWQELLAQDLLPVWRYVAASRSPHARTLQVP